MNNDKVKKFMNRKILLGVSSLLMCIGLIAVSSFIPFIIDPTRWQTKDFLTDELITVAIIVFCMVSAMFIGQAGNAQDERSNIAKARAKFLISVDKIVNINSFNQWVKKIMQPNDIDSMHRRIMRQAGIEDYRVLDLERDQIRSLLEKPGCFNDLYFKGLSKKQIKTIIDIKDGKYKVTFVEPEYYLSTKTLIDARTITERSSKEGIKKGLFLAKSVVSRVVLTVITAMIFASLMRDLSAQEDMGEATMTFFSRLWSMISSSFMGYIVGCQINDIDAEYIEMRISVHERYLNDKEFIPLDQQEEAKRDYEKLNERKEE